MADNKKYYYMRLKDSFFDSNEIVLLESMQDGYIYSNILLKLYLRSLKDDGKLMFNDRIPYNAQMIATITRHQVGTVEKALKLFCEMELIEILETGAIYMLDIQNFIGETSTEADRIRAYDRRIKNEKTKGVDFYDISTPEIEIKKEIELDIKKEKKNKYGFYKHVLLTPSEYEILSKDFKNIEECITFLDEYIEMKGYKAKSHYLAIRKWVVDAVKERELKKPKKTDVLPSHLQKGAKTDDWMDNL